MDKTGHEKVEIQAALWYNNFLTVKVCENPARLTENSKLIFVKMGNRSLKGEFA